MIKRILVPVDGSDHALKAVDLAVSLAGQNDTIVHFLHVAKSVKIDPAIEDYLEVEGIKASPLALYNQSVRDTVLIPAEARAKSHGINNVTLTMLRGDPAREIIDYAQDHEFDLIVMGSRGLGSVKGLMMGSVSTRVCHATDRTCVIVRKSLLDGKKVLIADDEPDVLETLEELLPMCEVESASAYDEAKRLLENQDFDLAILDIMGVDGYTLLDTANEKKVKTVMLTAHALSPKDVVKSHEKGAAFYVPKEKMAHIATFLTDVLEAKEKGENTWRHWLKRLGSYFDDIFGMDWQQDDKRFWNNFPYYY